MDHTVKLGNSQFAVANHWVIHDRTGDILNVVLPAQVVVHTINRNANWKQGEDVIILASVSDEAAKEKFPQGWKTLKPYLRLVKLE